jgi:ribosome-associated translation inhibitor RaiA
MFEYSLNKINQTNRRAMKINMTAVHFDADQKLIGYIEKKTAKLEQFFDRIIDAQVFLKLENSGQVRGQDCGIKAPGARRYPDSDRSK